MRSGATKRSFLVANIRRSRQVTGEMARSFVGPNADAELATLSGASEIICSSVCSPFVALARNGDEEVAVLASRRVELLWLSCASSWSTRSAHPYNMVDVETAAIKIQGALGPLVIEEVEGVVAPAPPR